MKLVPVSRGSCTQTHIYLGYDIDTLVFVKMLNCRFFVGSTFELPSFTCDEEN